jgi:hypothetical protein
MVKYIKILILIFFINCITTQSQVSKPEIKVSMQNGCYQYKGKDWDSCIIKLVKEFQDIYNAPVDREEISSERISEELIRVNTKYCIKSICFEEVREDYSPSLTAIVKNNLLFFLGGFFTGLITGLKTGVILLL